MHCVFNMHLALKIVLLYPTSLCRDVMCLPSLKQHVYSALSPTAQPAMAVVEARLNVMQTVFLALRSFSDPAQAEPSNSLLADSQKIFHTLFNRHFDEDMEVCGNICVHTHNVTL